MLLIKNVKIIDGTGKPAYPADVLVSGDKISAIGNFPSKKSDETIEGLGGYLTPGFIDINTDSDHQLTLFTNPGQENFLLQGVTTIIGGHCGSSLAPLLYGSLESIRKWTDTDQVNVDWLSFEEFLNALRKKRLGVNFGSLVGHSTIRRALIGEDKRDLTEKEMKIFMVLVRDSLEQGALGFSTGLGYAHSRQTPYREIKSLVGLLANYNGVYTTHLRDEKTDVFNSVNETLKIYKETGVKTVISHFRPLIGFEKNFESAMELIEKSADRMDFHFDVYPFNTSIVPIYTLLPLWAQKGGLAEMLAVIIDPNLQKNIIKELPRFKNGDLTIAYSPANKILANKIIADKKELLEIMIATGLRALVFYKNIDYKRLEEAIFSEKSLIASNSGGLGERATSTFTKFLELASIRKDYPLEEAIKKITSSPAAKFNIKNRGFVKEGGQADLAVILNNKIQHVIVNGIIAVRNGKYQQSLAGKVI